MDNVHETPVVITLEIATEALAEQSDSTGVTLIEETLGAPRERNNDLTKCEFKLLYSH